MITFIKNVILFCLRPLERRGIQFTMRCKTLPTAIVSQIGNLRKSSFCPFSHFDVAWRGMEHIKKHQIAGDVVLCGVSKGGLAKFLLLHLPQNKRLWLYDTFDGGSLPGQFDGPVEVVNGKAIKKVMAVEFCSVRDFVDDLSGRCEWVVGDVMRTIPDRIPHSISLLYLDTDYYESTKHELVNLEPRVTAGGVIVQDDMGLCVGARRAVEEYYGKNLPLIIPMDEAGSVWTKTNHAISL